MNIRPLGRGQIVERIHLSSMMETTQVGHCNRIMATIKKSLNSLQLFALFGFEC